jgi:hypothetical protein
MTSFYLAFLNVVRNLDENINFFFISFHFFIFNQLNNVLNVLINVFKLIFFFKSFFIFVWRLYHDIFDVINVNNKRWAMLTSLFKHSKCSKRKLITQQRSRFVSKKESSSSSAKIVKERKRSAELTRRSRDALRARIMINSSINVTLIAINMTKWTSENKKSWCHRSRNELVNFFRFFRRCRFWFLRRSNQNLEKNEWCLILRCLFARQFKIKSRKKKWRVN